VSGVGGGLVDALAGVLAALVCASAVARRQTSVVQYTSKRSDWLIASSSDCSARASRRACARASNPSQTAPFPGSSLRSRAS
jgi:hypothetical protein